MAFTEAGGGYTPSMAAGAFMPRPVLPTRAGLPTRGTTGATAHETSLVHSSR